jgi:hypothetical protein
MRWALAVGDLPTDVISTHGSQKTAERALNKARRLIELGCKASDLFGYKDGDDVEFSSNSTSPLATWQPAKVLRVFGRHVRVQLVDGGRVVLAQHSWLRRPASATGASS